jgi:hypothetical protein
VTGVFGSRVVAVEAASGAVVGATVGLELQRSGMAVVARMCCAAGGCQFYGADAARAVRRNMRESVARFVN